MTNDEVVDKLLFPLWLGIGNGYKSRYRATIWVQFENAIRSAAYTHKFALFLDAITKKLCITTRIGDAAGISEVCGVADQIGLLGRLRSEATLFVVLVQVKNDERKTGRKEHDDDKDTRRDTDRTLFNLT